MSAWLRSAALALASLLSLTSGALAYTDLETCLANRELLRVVRVLSPSGNVIYARVTAVREGVPTAVEPIAGGDVPLKELFDLHARALSGGRRPVWAISDSRGGAKLCAPVALSQADIDAEKQMIVAAGLNYAAHAEEAGGGDVFLFPKPVEPTQPYGTVPVPEDATLLDYEVELGFVLLADVELRRLPTLGQLLAQTAFFVANEVSDREPIIRHKALSGPGTGFVDGKGRPGFLPLGPWMVRGSDLFAALDRCGAAGLGLELSVDEGDGYTVRQDSTTDRMILNPIELLSRIGAEVANVGLRTKMPARRVGGDRYYPLAVDQDNPRLPAGSIVLTGTPDGVALRAPSSAAVFARGLFRLRGPFEQFRREELERAAAGGPGGYLEPGDLVRARIDGLGAQIVRIGARGVAAPPDPCRSAQAEENVK